MKVELCPDRISELRTQIAILQRELDQETGNAASISSSKGTSEMV